MINEVIVAGFVMYGLIKIYQILTDINDDFDFEGERLDD